MKTRRRNWRKILHDEGRRLIARVVTVDTEGDSPEKIIKDHAAIEASPTLRCVREFDSDSRRDGGILSTAASRGGIHKNETDNRQKRIPLQLTEESADTKSKPLGHRQLHFSEHNHTHIIIGLT